MPTAHKDPYYEIFYTSAQGVSNLLYAVERINKGEFAYEDWLVLNIKLGVIPYFPRLIKDLKFKKSKQRIIEAFILRIIGA